MKSLESLKNAFFEAESELLWDAREYASCLKMPFWHRPFWELTWRRNALLISVQKHRDAQKALQEGKEFYAAVELKVEQRLKQHEAELHAYDKKKRS